MKFCIKPEKDENCGTGWIYDPDADGDHTGCWGFNQAG